MDNLAVSDYEIGLTKLIGKPIKEVRGYLSMAFGYDAVFLMTKIEFTDGTFLDCEGEHDCPYLVEYDKQPNFDQETLNELYQEE